MVSAVLPEQTATHETRGLAVAKDASRGMKCSSVSTAQHGRFKNVAVLPGRILLVASLGAS